MTVPISVMSSDGTKLRLVRAGTGKPVVLVHGTMGAKEDWAGVSRRLSDDFEVNTFDRRGRGESEDGAEYSIEREIDDLLAVIDACRHPVCLIGHSFGAVLSLLVAARAGDRVEKLVLYEPPVGEIESEEDWLDEDELDAMVATGEVDRAVEVILKGVGATAQEIEANRSRPRVWAALQDGVRTAGREMRAAKTVLPIAEDVVASVRVPTLVLMGAEQDNASYNGLRDLTDQLQSAQLEYVPGRHLALIFAPDDFVAAVKVFLVGAS